MNSNLMILSFQVWKQNFFWEHTLDLYGIQQNNNGIGASSLDRRGKAVSGFYDLILPQAWIVKAEAA